LHIISPTRTLSLAASKTRPGVAVQATKADWDEGTAARRQELALRAVLGGLVLSNTQYGIRAAGLHSTKMNKNIPNLAASQPRYWIQDTVAGHAALARASTILCNGCINRQTSRLVFDAFDDGPLAVLSLVQTCDHQDPAFRRAARR